MKKWKLLNTMSYILNDPTWVGNGMQLTWTYPPAGFIGTLDPLAGELYIQRSTTKSNWPLQPNFVKNVGGTFTPTPETGWTTIGTLSVPPQYLTNTAPTDPSNLEQWQISRTFLDDTLSAQPTSPVYYRIVGFMQTDVSAFTECDWQPAVYTPVPVSIGGEWVWQKTLSMGGGELYPYSAKTDSSGNVFVGGFTRKQAYDLGGGTRASSTEDYKMFLVKYSPSGTYIWDIMISNGRFCQIRGMAVDGAGDVIVTGGIGKFPGQSSPVNFGNGIILSWSPDNVDQIDVFVAKFSGSTGLCQWAVKYDELVSNDFGQSVAIDGSNNIIIGGSVSGDVNFGGGNRSVSGQRGFVLALTSSGVYRWDKVFSGTNNSITYAVAVDSSGDVVCTGLFDGTANFGNGNIAAPAVNSAFVVKLSFASGAWIWQQVYGSANAYGVACDPNTKDVIVVGTARTGCNFGSGSISNGSGASFYIVKYGQASGAFNWQKVYGGDVSCFDIAYAVTTDGAGNIFAVGTFKSSFWDFGDGFVFGNGLDSYLLISLTPSSAFRWKRKEPQDAIGVSEPRGVFATTTHVVMAGNYGGTNNFGGPVVTGSNQGKAFFTVSYTK